MKKLAVNVESLISARQWRDFWEKVELNKINSENFQKFLDNPGQKDNSERSGLISLSRARKILGWTKILSVVNYNKIWGRALSEFPIHYCEYDLGEAAFKNENGDDWRLVFYGGQSIAHIRRRFGIDPKSQPCFSWQQTDWYLWEQEKFWMGKVPEPGYYLINFKGSFMSLNHGHQEKHIKEIEYLFGNGLERTDVHIFAETLFSLFKMHEKSLAETWYHWSGVKSSNGYLVYLGKLSFNGFEICATHSDESSRSLRVSLCVKQR